MGVEDFNENIKRILTNNRYNLDQYDTIENNFSKSIKDFNNKIFYEQVDEIFEKVKRDCNTKKDDLKKTTIDIETQKKNLSKRIESFQKKEFYEESQKSLEDLQSKMKPPSANDSKNVVSNIDTFKSKFLDIFDKLYTSAESYEKKLEQVLKKNSVNNLKFYYERDKSFTTIIDNLKEINSNKTKIDDLTKELSTYYAKSKFIFLDYLEEEIVKKNKSKELEPFYTKYKEMCEELNQKIEILLNNINKGITQAIVDPFLKNALTNFTTTTISGKISNCNKITKNDTQYSSTTNHKKGKYIEVLKYTDIMLYYIINLLIIIDYLTTFYT